MNQITMAYAYWRARRHDLLAVFELFFRNNPFQGEYTLFVGFDELIRFAAHYRFWRDEFEYLGRTCPKLGDEFLAWIGILDGSRLKIYAVHEGSVVFARVPIVRV